MRYRAPAILLLAILAVFPTAARAATFVVDSTADVGDAVPYDGVCATAGGACTLRAATTTAYEVPGAHVIMVPSGTYVLTIGFGLGVFQEPVTIVGAGAATTVIDGNGSDWVLKVQNTSAEVRDVTIRNGRIGIVGDDAPITLTRVIVTENGNPGALEGSVSFHAVNQSIACVVTDSTISNNGGTGILADRRFPAVMSLTVRRSTIAGNSGRAGGGISVDGNAEIDECTIAGNAAAWPGSSRVGGGINHGGFTYGDGVLTLTRSTVRDNSATSNGGGVYTVGSGLIENTTISGNTANGSGGGLYTVGAINLRIRNVTITGNVADGDANGFGAGGGWIGGGELSSSIVAGNTDVGGETDDCGGTITSGGFNLIERYENCTITGTLTGNVLGRPAGLGPLAMNGGPTETQAPLPGSQVLDAGNPALPGSGPTACATTDQRSGARPHGSACDIGAVEDTYVVTSCGNGAIDGGEQCDDGNVRDGDCCSRTCQLDGAGVPCFDANRCTDDACDGAGACVATNNTAPCNDNLVCTTADTCAGGSCVGGPPPACDDGADCTTDSCHPSFGCQHAPNNALCDDGDPCTGDFCQSATPPNGCVHSAESGASCDDGSVCTLDDICRFGACVGQSRLACDDCLACDPVDGCAVLGPEPVCDSANQIGRSQLQLKDAANPASDGLKWDWSSPSGMPLEEFGAPTGSTTYDLCIYDQSSGTPSLLLQASPAVGLCGTTPCWRTTLKSHVYKDPTKAGDGVTGITLKTIFPQVKIAVRAKGANLPSFGLPLAADPAVVVQLRSSNGRCWGASYTAPSRNDGERFKAKSD